MSLLRVLAALPLVVALMLVACGDDDSESESNGSSSTPFIAPEALTDAQAIALLDEIEGLVREPNRAVVAVAQVGEAEVQTRTGSILVGDNDVSGLDDVRAALEAGDRVGAGEYLYNVVLEDSAPLSDSDSSEIDPETLDDLDPKPAFDEDHDDGMTVSAIYKDAIIKMMELWYGLIGVPPEESPST
jgi:hypothetical protein